MSSRQIVNRNADHLDHSNQPPDEAWLSHKLEEEHSPTVSPARISGILLQLSNYEDSSSVAKNQQTSQSNQATEEGKSCTIMPLDCQPIREDDVDDSSHRRSTTPHSLLAEGSQHGLETGSTEMGKCIPFVRESTARVSLVREMGNNQERSPNTSSFNKSSEYRPDHTYKRLTDRWSVQSKLITTSGFWTNEEKELSINVLELKTILFALQLHTPSAANSIINLYTDNVTALKHVGKPG
ncbi:hypothetical protein BCV71DRAFT_283432, partial [Rhizopus microsporus]